MSTLRDLVTPEAVRLDAPAADWRAAIRAAGDLLVATDITTEAYTDAMVGAVEKHGPYIVLTPGFALAHARPDASVHRTGLSFVRLAEPVEFGHESNDPVTLVMALAAVDADAHQQALAQLAGILADPTTRSGLDSANTRDEVLDILAGDDTEAAEPGSASSSGSGSASPAAAPAASAPAGTAGTAEPAEPVENGDTVPSKNLILTVCGNGLGTSLFLKNTTEQVLGRWGWAPYLNVEATDTISAKGKAKDSDLILTSGAIAETLGDVGVPVEVIENFTSLTEIDDVLRRRYAV